MTSTSCHGAEPRSCETTSPIASASFMAGITIETDDASAKQPLHDSVPGDRARARAPRASEARRELPVGRETRDRLPERLRVGRAHESILAVDHELEGAA